MNKIIFKISLLMFTFFLWVNGTAQVTNDSIPPLPYPFTSQQDGSLYLSDFDNYEVIYDAENDRYVVVSLIGNFEIRIPIVMTQEEYAKYRLKKEMHDYYKRKVSAVSGNKQNSADEQKDLLPKYYVNSDLFATLFGSNEIEVKMQGNIEVKLGVLYQKVDNPQLNETNRTSTIFDFDQNIGASITAKVGKRLKISANYDTQSTFDFQNIIKLEFDPSIGYDDDGIIRKIEVGNVSMPMRNTLISGAQNLFGFKTELQFGRTTITTAFAKQQSQTKSVVAQGGSIIEEFELKASDYDADRHFFLAQYFKDNFDNALINYPLINSAAQITKVELWVTNTNRSTENVRNIVALADLGESVTANIGNADISVTAPLSNFIPDNDVNELQSVLTANSPIRNISTVPNAFLGIATMAQGRDFSVLENARRLVEGVDFIINKQLGYISLNRRLADSEVLAVAFEYTVNGSSEVYKVGELSSDGIPGTSEGAPGNLVVKLLRSELVITDVPMWHLMMKNIYNLQAYQLQQEGFRLELLYANDATGVPINSLQNAQTVGVADRTLLNLFHIDRLDSNQAILPEGDGYFDFVNDITIFPQKGHMMFPKVQPFGNYLASELTNVNDSGFLFNELYQYTQTEVKNNFQQRDKYQIKGYYKSDSAQGIALGAFNVPQGSVRVTSGGRELVEGVDYVVDYQIGRVKIINPSLEAANAPIEVSLEQNAIFNQQRRSFFGLDIEHKFSDNLVVGASFLNLTEQPFTNKVLYGQEPIKNSIFGMNASYNNKSDFLTRLANKISFGESETESNFSIRGDVAYLIPGTPKSIDINGVAASYVDDFEGTQIPIDVRSQLQWFLAATPQNQSISYLANLGGDAVNSLDYGKKRARLAWYNIDNDMHGGANQPASIDNNELSRAEVRRINVSELFPNDELDLTESTILRTLDLAYYPSERGEYNFDTNNVNPNGTFTDPQNRWAGITRPMTVTDFENSNIEYIQFWMMDPYENYSITNTEGLPIGVNPQDAANQVGELYFNLGNVSEDILKDNRKMYENGLPDDGGVDNTASTIWGKIPTNQSLLYAFDDDDDHRLVQDIGLDGLSDTEEQSVFASFVSAIPSLQADPASDNYMFYKSSEYDDLNAGVLTRYKKYNNTQGNSPTANMSPEDYSTAATQYPDTEDINKDQTMSTVEGYFQYKVSLNKPDLVVGQNYIVDQRVTTNTLANGGTQSTTWYQFRIPIAEGTPIGGINNFHSIRFMRMFLTQFKMPVVLRFGQMEMVRGEWRRYKYELADGNIPITELDNFESGVVNIEENDGRSPIPYVLPPGIERERLQGTTTVQLQNEQSLVLKVRDLMSGEGRSLFKNVNFDMRMFKKLQMFIHAESLVNQAEVADDEIVAIIRIGSDLSENYYQIEKPLKITAFGTSTASDIWPEDNELNVDLEALKKLKLERFEDGIASNVLYPIPVVGEPVEYRIRVKGNPNLGKIKTIMLGVKNEAANDRSAELWFNELRVSEFDNEGGWAAVVSADANLSDLMDISVAGRMSTMGYGNVDQSVNERSQEDTKQYDAVASINAGKLLPEKVGMQIPVNLSISEEIRDPKYDAQYQDILLEDTNDTNSPNRNDAQDYTKRTSFSIINMKKMRNPESTKKQRFYDVENLGVSYAFNQVYHHDYNVEKYLDQNVRASLGYNYNFKAMDWSPFKNSTALKSEFLKIIKDLNFNPIPTTISVNSSIIRSYNEQLSRTLIEGLPSLPTLKQRNFMFDWDYNIGLKPTQSIRLNFRALNNYVYDDYNYNDDVRLYTNFFDTGSPVHYHQTLDGSYQIPIDKIPLFSFVKSNYAYTADFDWQGTSADYVSSLGNTIQNANTHNLSVDLDMKKLYKELGLESLMRTKSEKDKDRNARLAAKKKKEEGGEDAVYIKPKLTQPSLLNNSKKKTTGQSIVVGLFDLVTSLKSVKISYSENNGTLLPGYTPSIGLLGRDNFSGGFAPTFGFVFGSQVDIRNQALENGWLLSRNINDPYYSKIFARTHYNKLDVSAKVTPFKDLDIDVKANKIYTRNLSEQMDIVTDIIGSDPYFAPSVVTETGNFSMSYMMLGTSFDDPDALFNNFKANRQIIAQRLSDQTGLDVNGYGNNSQLVILPAFLSAYSGQSVDQVKLNPFRDIPLPNWQINYRGLMKLNWFKKNFSSFSISHAYRSSYTIVNFSNNSQYNANVPDALDISGNYFSKQLFTNVGLIEEFSPLVKVEMKLKNSFTLSGRINMDRAMTLNFNNNTLTQDNGKEYVIGLGYRFKDVPFNMRLQGKKMKFKGDLNLKLDVSLRDDLLMVRYFGEDENLENNQVTGGQKMFNLRFIADYNLTKNLQSGLYYVQDASRYAISTTYPRQSISAGISFKYNLGNQ
jgi:cell surface protein SprA